jgi:hypothetical protein
MTIDTLIDKQDGFEIVRDVIATILKAEIASQMSLATAGGKDPELWDIRIFTERSDAWEQWLNDQSDTRPICNVWYDGSDFPQGSGNVVRDQKSEGVFNIDVYGYGQSADDGATGHTPGDKEAAFECHRGIRLIRNILMAALYTYLSLRGTVWKRWIQSVRIFQPEYNGQAIQNVVAARISFGVDFSEFSPQVTAETLEYISITTKRLEDGEIVLVVDYDFS